MIIDASVAFKWLVEEQDSAAAIGWIGRAPFHAPALLHAEVGNALWKRIMRGEIAAAGAAEQLAGLALLIDCIPEESHMPRALELASELRHPLYDCVYLAIAESRDVPLLTADQQFAKALGGTRHAERVITLHGEPVQ